MTTPIVIVRVYVTESRAHAKQMLKRLRDSHRLSGATIFRGVAGFGSSMPDDVDASAPTDPPLVIEFFDTEAAVQDTIRLIKTLIAPRHIIIIRAESC